MEGNCELGVEQMKANGHGLLPLKPKLKRLDYGVCGGLRILLYGSFPLKLEEFSSQNTHTKKFYSKLTLFYRKRVSCMHLDLIPTFSTISLAFWCTRLVPVTGFAFNISIPIFTLELYQVFESRFYSFSSPTVPYLNSNST